MGRSVACQLINAHLVEGEPRPGEEIGLRIDQTLTQDATGTLVMLELRHDLSPRQVRTVLAGGLITQLRDRARR
jgi:aconitate hydratase